MYNNTLTLNNGAKIPQLGLGTWFIDDAKVADAVKEAVKLGYRHIDTAQAYGNERGVGEGVRNCGVSREKLFVVSKVAAEHKTYKEAKAGIDETLEKMGLDYLDMMIIHSPQPWLEVNQSDDRYVEGNRAAWRALEDAYKEGKLKAIGISNFQIGDIESLLETAEVKPMVNQILLHISNTPLELVEYCQKRGIVVEAYSPIAHGEILNQPEIKVIADKYGVTIPQLCIRYTLQLGAIALPKTADPEHMKSNAEVNFEISAEDMEALKIVQTAGRTALGEYAPQFAHFNDDVLFGENWNNQDIDVKTRSIITVVSLMSMGITDSSLKFHLQNAKTHGVTQKEIVAVITHVAFYAGWPKAWAVFNLAKEVWNVNEGDLPYEDEAMRAHAKEMVFPIGAPNEAIQQA